MLCDFHRAKSIPIMALWSSGMIPPSGKTLVKCSKHGGGPDFDYRQSPFVFLLDGSTLYYYSDYNSNSSAVYICITFYFTVCCKSRRQFFCSRTKLGNISTASPLASSREFSPSLPNTALILLTTISALISTRLRIYLLVLSASRSRLTRSQRFV